MGTPILDFSSYIDERTRDFTGRAWLFKEFEAWLRTRGAPRHFMIVGEPGIGKTAIAARLTRLHRVAAMHFCIARQVDTVDPLNFVRSIAHQLTGFPGFAQQMLENAGIHIDVSIGVHENYGQIVGVLIENLILEYQSALTAYTRTVITPLKQLYANGFEQQLVILVDALDEAVQPQWAETIVDLLARAQEMPRQVRFVLTSRKESRVLRQFEQWQVPLLLLDAERYENMQDARRYIHNQLKKSRVLHRWHAEYMKPPQMLINRVAKASQGNFLYLTFLLPALATGSLRLDGLDELPKGLSGVYRELLRLRTMGKDINVWRTIYRPLFGVLAVARASLTAQQLAQFTSLDRQVLYDLLLDLQQFLDPSEVSQNRYRLYHQSIAEFLCNQEWAQEFWIDLRPIHLRIVDYYRGKAATWDQVDWESVDSLYPLHHLAFHLTALGSIEDLYALVATGQNQLKWAERHFRAEDSYVGYLNDLRMLWDQVESQKNWDFARQVRCMLIEASTHSLAANITPLLLFHLVNTQAWEPTAALEYIRQMPSYSQQVSTLKKLIPLLSDEALLSEAWAIAGNVVGARIKADAQLTLIEYMAKRPRADVIEEVWKTVQAITGSEDRASASVRLMKYLPAKKQRQALEVVQNISDERIRAQALVRAAEYRLKNLEIQIVESIRGLVNERIRASALVGLIPSLSSNLKTKMLNEALKMAEQTTDESLRAFVYLYLAEYLPDELKAQTLRLVARIADEDERSTSLLKLAAYLPDDLKDQIVVLTQRITNEIIQGYTLGRIVEYLPEELKARVFGLAQHLPTDSVRMYCLFEMTDHLPAALSKQAGEEALELVREIVDDRIMGDVAPLDERAYTLVGRAKYLPGDLQLQTLILTQRIVDEEERAPALIELARYLPDDLKVSLLRAVQEGLTQKDLRAYTLIDLIEYLPQGLQGKVALEALRLRQRIGDERERANLFVALANYASGDLKSQALSSALSAARNIPGEKNRAFALARIAEYLSGESKFQVNQEVLKAIQQIADEEEQIAALAELSDYLSNGLESQQGEEMQVTHHGSSPAPEKIFERQVSPSTNHDPDHLKLQEIQRAWEKVQEIADAREWVRKLSQGIDLGYLPDDLKDDILGKVLRVIKEYGSIEGCADIIAKITSLRKQDTTFFDSPDKQEIWCELLHARSRSHRRDVMRDLTALIPVFARLCSQATLNGIFDDVRDVARWWP